MLQSGFLNQVPFDPLGMKNDDMREKEIKNGRLAMVAFVGFSSQAAVQGKGPIASLKYHLADPFHHNSESPSVIAGLLQKLMTDNCNMHQSSPRQGLIANMNIVRSIPVEF